VKSFAADVAFGVCYWRYTGSCVAVPTSDKSTLSATGSALVVLLCGGLNEQSAETLFGIAALPAGQRKNTLESALDGL